VVDKATKAIAPETSEPSSSGNDPRPAPDVVRLADTVRQYQWFHSIDLGRGVVTPGVKSPAVHALEAAAHALEAAAFFDPIKIEGLGLRRVRPPP
jgi:hypothetical protein